MIDASRTTDDARDEPDPRGGARHVLHTPDGRYIVVKGRLWRASNPALPDDERQRHVDALMRARREVGVHQRDGNATALRHARREVHAAKVALGERGPVWWTDGTPDYNRYLVKNTPYVAWYRSVGPGGGA